MKAPRLPKLILPSLSMEQVRYLIEYVESTRDKAIIASNMVDFDKFMI
jgi:hypothetical protein